MKAKGMASSYSRARYRPHPAKPNDGPAPNLSAREFDGYKPHTHLASDPAYVMVGNSWAYVCLPGDLANREIAGHSVGVRHDPELVLAAFATLRFPLGDIEVLHTDRGGEFAGERIERMLDVFGITRSLSRPGTPYDNAVVESTDRLIKKELIYANTYTSVEQLRSDVNRYVWWYNHQRLHSTLGYMSPMEFTRQGKTLQEQSNTPLPIHATCSARDGAMNTPTSISCSLAIKAGQGILTDQEWESVIRDYLTRMNIIDGDKDQVVTWLAVRHGLSANGNDHVRQGVAQRGRVHTPRAQGRLLHRPQAAQGNRQRLVHRPRPGGRLPDHVA